jgi:hypothetical protein
MAETDLIWIPDEKWTVKRCGICRGSRGCPNEAVAYLYRTHYNRRHHSGPGRKTLVTYRYCADHLYGGEIRDGKVWIQVYRDSPIARQYLDQGGQR